jgi:site-specific recombinase XerD
LKGIDVTKELIIVNTANALQIKDAAWQSLSPESRKSYSYDYKLFYEVIKKNPKDITPADIQQYVKHLEDHNYKNNSISRKIASLSKLFKIMVMADEIRINPVDVLKQFQRLSYKTSKSIQVGLTLQEIQKTVKINKKDTVSEKRIKIIVHMLAMSGLRISECINIKNDDISPFNETTYIVKILGKGKKERKIYIESEFLSEIRKIFPVIKDVPYLFYSNWKDRYNRQYLWRVIHQLFQDKIGKDVWPHKLRHFFISYKISVEKQDIKAVSRYAGHSDTSTTLNMYVDTELNVEDAMIKI